MPGLCPTDSAAPRGRVQGAVLRYRFRFALLAWSMLAMLPVPAQERPEAGLSVDTIQARIAALEPAVEEADAELALAAYRRTLASLQEAERYAAQALEYETAGIESARQQARVRERIAAGSKAEALPALGQSESVAEVEQRLALARAELLAATQTLDGFGEQIGRLRERPAGIQQRVAVATQEIRGIQAELGSEALLGSGAADDPQVMALRARSLALSAELGMLEQELLTLPARLALLETRRDEALMSAEHGRQRVQALQALVTDLRAAEAARALAESGAAGLRDRIDSEAIRAVIDRNVELAGELTALGQATRAASEEHQAAQQRLESLRRRFDSARQKLDIAGMSPALGRFLQTEQRDLPLAVEFSRASRLRAERISAAGLRSFLLAEELDQWRPASAQVERLLAAVETAEPMTVRSQIEALARARQDLLTQLIAANNDYLRGISELEATERQALQVVEGYREFLARNLMWMRNETPLSPAKLMQVPGELRSVLTAPIWTEGFGVLMRHSLVAPVQMLAWLLVVLMIWKRAWLLDRLRATARPLARPSGGTMAATFMAIALTLVLTIPWPLFVLMTGHQLAHGPLASAASGAFGAALSTTVPLLFFLLGARNLCLPGGLAEAHFHWSGPGLAVLRRELLILGLTLLLPGLFLMVASHVVPADATLAFGQLVYLVLVVGVVRFVYLLLRPGDSIIASLRGYSGALSSPAWAWTWLLTALAMPLLMGAVAMAGFMYSAAVLADRVVETLLFVLVIVLARELGTRWLLLMRRRVRLREALARRAAAREADGGEGGSPGIESGEYLASLDADSRKLINVLLAIATLLGLVAIWSPVFPALGTLSSITLWQYVQEVSGERLLRRVSLADVALAVLLTGLTIAAARSLPALVEILLRQRGTVSSGSRLAFATLARYGIVLAGVALVFSIIGVDWSKLQWLVAALGVGIGFGLQEIVANFISGLIILVERPVRVGDVVTVGDASGKVVRIQIRATTIRNWDEQEMIVPNKEFITSRVTNWSLSDETSRIHFLVGVAYGSDVEQALRLIEAAAVEHPVVLEDPPPTVTFESFGDSTLNLGIRCYVPRVSDRIKTISALHLAINRKFNEAGISIAFPQRDVHLDTSSPLEVRLLRGGTAPSDPQR